MNAERVARTHCIHMVTRSNDPSLRLCRIEATERATFITYRTLQLDAIIFDKLTNIHNNEPKSVTFKFGILGHFKIHQEIHCAFIIHVINLRK